MAEKKNPVQYSPDINEIIEKKPHWLIRAGIGGMLFFLILIFILAWFIQYPEIISGGVYITTPRPPSDVVSRVSANVLQRFPLKENDTVVRGQPILLLESTTSYSQVLELRKNLNKTISDIIPMNNSAWLDSLGELQAAYNSHTLASRDLNYYALQQPFKKRINILKSVLHGNSQGLKFSQDYLANSKIDFESKQLEYKRFKRLFEKGVIAASEFEKVRQAIIQKEMGLLNDHKNLNTERISRVHLQGEIVELLLQKNEFEVQLQRNYIKTQKELKSRLEAWEAKYLICAPINGRLSFFNSIHKGDFVVSGERVMTIIPLQNQKLQAVGSFSVKNAGKIQKGNKVILKLHAFPYHEYGTIYGIVTRISEIPIENEYSIIIELPQGLRTNHEKVIRFKQRLTATADVVIKDRNVVQRIFYQFENFFAK